MTAKTPTRLSQGRRGNALRSGTDAKWLRRALGQPHERADVSVMNPTTGAVLAAEFVPLQLDLNSDAVRGA